MYCTDSVIAVAYELAGKNIRCFIYFNKESKKLSYNYLQSFLSRNPSPSIRISKGRFSTRVKRMNKN